MSDPRPAVYSRMCDTCVFRSGNPMHLQPGRLREIVAANLDAGALLICHKTTYGQQAREVACRGFYDAYGDRVNVVRVMNRLAVQSGYASGFQEIEVSS